MRIHNYIRNSFALYHQLRFYTNPIITNNYNKFSLQLCYSGIFNNNLLNKQEYQIISVRQYAKGKDKKKEKDKKRKIEINVAQLESFIKYESYKNQLENSIEKLKEDYIKNLSLRSSSGSLESLPVTFEGNKYTLMDLGQVIRKNPKTIVVNMISFPTAIPDVLKAIQSSGMNLNPQQDGTTLFIQVPKVSKEHRETLAKNAKALFIKCRDSIKDIRTTYIKKVKNNKTISEDESFNVQEQITYVADQYLTEATKIHENKEAELLGKS